MLDREIVDADKLRVLEARLDSVNSNVKYHSEQLTKYTIEQTAIEEHIRQIKKRMPEA